MKICFFTIIFLFSFYLGFGQSNPNELLLKRNLKIDFQDHFEGITACDIPNLFIFNYKIENIGTKIYPKNSKIWVEYEDVYAEVFLTKYIYFQEEFYPNDTLYLSDTIDLSKLTIYWDIPIVKVCIEDDFDTSDNCLDLYWEGYTNDKVLFLYHSDLDDSCTSIFDQTLHLAIRNESCHAIEIGEVIEVNFYNEDHTFGYEYIFQEKIEKGEVFSIDIDLSILPKDFGLFNLKLDYKQGYFLFGGYRSYLDYRQLKPFPTRNINFDDSIAFFDYFKFSNTFHHKRELVQYQHEKMLSFSSAFSIDYIFDWEKKDDANEFFEFRHQSSFKICVDVHDIDDPFLSFDLAFLQNQIAENLDIDTDFYTMVKIEIDGESKLIYKQKNGRVIYHEYPIPKNYKGEIIFNVAVFGPYDEKEEDVFKNRNWVLFDNFHLFDKAKKDTTKYFSISPNPVSDVISFKPLKLIDYYSIYFYDVQGREIDSFSDVEGIFQYDTQKLAKGIVFFQIIKNSKLIQRGKFIVLN